MIASNGYQSGFANEFATESVAGTLPVGRNSPQRVAHGLYAEQVSGTAFTAPRRENRRSWLYRIRPAAMHGQFLPLGEVNFHNRFDEQPATPNQLRWSPAPIGCDASGHQRRRRRSIAVNRGNCHPGSRTAGAGATARDFRRRDCARPQSSKAEVIEDEPSRSDR